MDRAEKSKLTAILVGAASIGALVLVGAVVAPALASVTEPAATALHLEAPPPGKAIDGHLATFSGNGAAGASAPAPRPLAGGSPGFDAARFLALAMTRLAPTPPALDEHLLLPAAPPPATVSVAEASGVYGWSDAAGWTRLPMADAGSITVLDATQTAAGR